MIYYKELAHTIIEAEKSKDLQSANWRLGKPRTWFLSASEELTTKSWWPPFQSESEAEGRVDSSSSVWRQSSKERGNPPLLHLFCSTQASSALDEARPYLGEQFALCSPPIQMLLSSRNTFAHTSRNNVEPNYLGTRWVKLTHKSSRHVKSKSQGLWVFSLSIQVESLWLDESSLVIWLEERTLARMKSLQHTSRAGITDALAVFIDKCPLVPILVFIIP